MIVDSRINIELNKTLKDLGVNEYGDSGLIKRRMYKKTDCQDAFINLMCWMNFPRCDLSTNETLPMCRSACENFFITCGYEDKLWRCGKSKWFNGYFPEYPRMQNGELVYLRDYFPGQPWRKNKYKKNEKDNILEELPICTPAITGASTKQHYFSFYWIILLVSISIQFMSNPTLIYE